MKTDKLVVKTLKEVEELYNDVTLGEQSIVGDKILSDYVRQTLEQVAKQAKIEAYEEILELVKQSQKAIHGGGNGRRLLIILRSLIQNNL